MISKWTLTIITCFPLADFPEIRIKDGQSHGLLEANQYGFWGPICDADWTDMEAHAACQQLGKAGGYAYYAATESDYPMVVGRFNCSDDVEALNECNFKGFGECLGCQYPIGKSSRRAAGVFCYDHHGKFQILPMFCQNWFLVKPFTCWIS